MRTTHSNWGSNAGSARLSYQIRARLHSPGDSNSGIAHRHQGIVVGHPSIASEASISLEPDVVESEVHNLQHRAHPRERRPARKPHPQVTDGASFVRHTEAVHLHDLVIRSVTLPTADRRPADALPGRAGRGRRRGPLVIARSQHHRGKVQPAGSPVGDDCVRRYDELGAGDAELEPVGQPAAWSAPRRGLMIDPWPASSRRADRRRYAFASASRRVKGLSTGTGASRLRKALGACSCRPHARGHGDIQHRPRPAVDNDCQAPGQYDDSAQMPVTVLLAHEVSAKFPTQTLGGRAPSKASQWRAEPWRYVANDSFQSP